MAGLTFVDEPKAFNVQRRAIVDWSTGAGGAPVGKQPVDGQPIYAVNGGVLMINANGRAAKRRSCDNGDIRLNLRDGEAIIVANDPSASALPDDTPFTLTFANPVRGVGAFVAVYGPNLPAGLPLHAVMWVLPVGGNWTSFSGHGFTGDAPLMNGEKDSAPFVGAKASGAERIAEVRFDATLMGNRKFKFLALSSLYGTP
ncbi:MAG: hypothetical protein HZC06_07945 [Methylocystis sp.]|nr:hypothetical protein [Methylocystis sp.]